MTTKYSAHGTKLKIGDGASSEAFTEIANCRSISGPTFALETVDVTSHSSPNHYREVIPSFLSGGEVSFELIYDPADVQHEKLFTDYEGRSLRNFKLVLTDTNEMEYAFAAYVTSMELQTPIDNAISCNVKLSISGAITRTS